MTTYCPYGSCTMRNLCKGAHCVRQALERDGWTVKNGQLENEEREAFMAAIVKLADDAEFRKSFMTHYNLWLHAPMIVGGDNIRSWPR